MDLINMDQDFNVSRITLQNILQSKDLSLPIQVDPSGKEDKDFTEIIPDASAAFLGPHLWDDCKTNIIDIDNFLGTNSDYRQPLLQNLDQATIATELQLQMCPEEASNMHMSDMYPTAQGSPHPSSEAISQSSFSEVDESQGKMYSVDCKFSSTDLALATPPGHKHYDPASATFPDEELKPQPIVKKSRKNFVPDNLKDDKYWVRRHKNNIAAKRSREARRLKENRIVLRASYLEKENTTLKEDVTRLRAENHMLKEQIKKYEE